MRKKLLALGLSVAMILGMTACGSEDAAKEPEVSKETSTVEVSQEESKAEESKAEVKEDPKELRLIMYGEMSPRREEFFEGVFHDKVLEDLNIDLEVEYLAWGALTGDVNNRLIAGEKFAYMHIPSETDQAQRGLCAEITQEDIDTYLPHHAEMRGDKGYECATVDGKIVAVPFGNKSYSANNKGITVHNNILNEVGWDYKDITTYEQLMDAFAAVHEKYPDMRIVHQPDQIIRGLDDTLYGKTTSGTYTYHVMFEEDNDDKVYSWYESEEFKTICDMAADWVELGYTKNDHLSDPSAARNDWNIGNCLTYAGVPGNMVEPGVKASMPEGTDLQIVTIGDLEHHYILDYDWGVSVSVAAKDDVPDYLRLFDWIYASQENYEFCIYGVEGTDWERNADGTITKLTSECMFEDWFLQAFCYHTYAPSISEETIARYESWDDGAKKSKVSGFAFDSSKVAAEKAAMDAIVTEYIHPIRLGYKSYDENFPEALELLKAAGLDAYMAEYQRQYSEWYAANR